MQFEQKNVILNQNSEIPNFGILNRGLYHEDEDSF